MDVYRLRKESFHPPAVASPSAGDEDEIPWILIENQAYVADRRNSTTAFSDCGHQGQIQVTLVVAAPPRVSYLCVFCRRRAAAAAGGGGGGGDRHTDDEAEEEMGKMIPVEPDILATDEDLVLLRIPVTDGNGRHRSDAFDLFVYQPAAPLLTRIGSPRPYPYGGYGINEYQVGLVSCAANRRDNHDGSSSGSGGGLSLVRPHYMVAALTQDIYNTVTLGRGHFILYLYNSKLQIWTAINVSLSDQHFQKYQNEQGYFVHRTTKVIAVGGEDATIAFVDLWSGILLCDLSSVQEQPLLRYVPLPNQRHDVMVLGDARLSRDIAVVKGRFKHVRKFRVNGDAWVSDMFTRAVSACSLSDDSWEHVCHTEFFNMDTEGSLNFHLLPKPDDLDGRPFSPFNYLQLSQPTLSLDTDHTVCFMAKIDVDDDKAWVITVDMKNNRLLEVAEFDASRYNILRFAYLHSRISKYLKMAQDTKENLKRQGIPLERWPQKKLAWRVEIEGMAEGSGDGGGAMPMG